MIGFLDARWRGVARLLKRVVHDVDDPLYLGKELDEGAVTPGRPGRALRGRAIFLSRRSLCPTRRLQQRRQIPIGGAAAESLDQLGDADARFGRRLVQHDVLEAWP